MSVVIRVENLGKKYRIQRQQRERYTALRDVIAYRAKSLFRCQSLAPNTQPPSAEDFWALKDVSCDNNWVEVLLCNGTDKPTLIRERSRSTNWSICFVSLKSHIASLFEVGTRIRLELTGCVKIILHGINIGDFSTSSIRL